MLTQEEVWVSEILVAGKLVSEEIVRRAGEEALMRRARGEQADVIGVLLAFQQLTQPQADEALAQLKQRIHAHQQAERAKQAAAQDAALAAAIEKADAIEEQGDDEAPEPRRGVSSRRIGSSPKELAVRSSGRQPAKKQSMLPLVLLGLLALVVLAIGMSVALSDPPPKDEPEPSPSSSASPTPTPSAAPSATPPPTPSKPDPAVAARKKALAEVEQAEAKGDYARALQLLDGIAADLRSPAHESIRVRIQRYARHAEQLQRALEKAPDGRVFKRWVEKIGKEEIEDDLLGLPATKDFLRRAEAEVGKERFKLLLEGEDEDDLGDVPEVPDDE